MQLVEYGHILDKIKESSFIVIDKVILDHYPDINEILKGPKYEVYVVENPEQAKNLVDFEKICNFFIKKGIGRKSTILAIGGGALSDLAGFVSSTLFRGITWRIIPTTLLAMIDASIGGKTGVNTELGKNLIGSFHLPQETYICPFFLKTLPLKHLESGKGELLKYGLLSERIFDLIEKNSSMNDLIIECAVFKEDVVNKDFQEGDLRKILNLGHTFGHAIEKANGVEHGVAVLFGLKLEIALFANHLSGSLAKAISTLGLDKVKIEKMNYQVFNEYLKNDKKRVDSSDVEIILLNKIGKFKIKTVSFDSIEKTLKDNELYKTYFK